MTPSRLDIRSIRRRPARSRRVLALALVAAAVTAGCVRQGGPDVKVNALDAELVFGVKETKENAPVPPEVLPPPPVADFIPFQGNPFEFPIFDDPKPNPCPEELVKATPRRDADVLFSGDLQNGAYTFRGAFITHFNNGAKLSQLPEETRVVRNYKRQPAPPPEEGDIVTYDYIQPFGAHFLKSRFQVKTLDTSKSVKAPTEPTTESPRVRTDREGGVVLMGTEVIDAAGNRVPGSEPFEPTTGVMLLPLPVASESFYGSGNDPRTGRTFVNQGEVKARDRVIACGEPVEGWFVSAFIAISDRDNPSTIEIVPGQQPKGDPDNQYRWDYIIAPQYGGLIIAESITREFGGPRPNETVIRRLKSIDPQPVP